MLKVITQLGDAALLLPAAALMFVYFLYLRYPRAAAAWVSGLMLGGGLVILAKLAFYTCGSHAPLFPMRSPSGHAAFAAVFYPSVALAAAADKRRPTRITALIAAGGLVAAIAVSRVALHAHTIAEVLVGLGVGGIAFAWFARWHDERSLPLRHLPVVIAVFVGLALVTYGSHFTIENAIAQLAALFRERIPVCA